MTTAIGPGTVLAGRYRLDDLLAENRGARFWRATDTVLARSVAIHAVPTDDPRAAQLLDAARVSATVTDPHLLRVLDCDDSGEITWVVNEWGDGLSLDLMLQQGPLSPSRAAWLAREVAEAIACGHAQGVAHGRLNPEAVMVTHAGAVKLIGYVVDAALAPARRRDLTYGELDDREADVIDVAGILYAGLTGRWPGVSQSSVPPAPREGRRPLRPRQVRAGVPRMLDAICDRVLHKEGSQHALPIETASEITAALSDYLGDPGLTAPVDLAGMHHEPTTVLSPGDLEGLAATDIRGNSETGPVVTTDVADAPVGAEGADTAEEPALPPPFEESPERPLFASTQRRVPLGGTGEQPPVPPSGTAPAPPPAETATAAFWPFTEDDQAAHDVHTGREGRGWLRTALVVGLFVALVVGMVVAFNLGRGDGEQPASTGSAPAEAQARGETLRIAKVDDFDPEGDPAEENPQDVTKAVDHDKTTGWPTMTYRNKPELGGLKSGVGLLLDLGEDQDPRSLTVRFAGGPTSFEVYAASPGVTHPPESVGAMDKVAARPDAHGEVTVGLRPGPTTRYLVIWLTRLPPVDGGFRGEITDLSVRS